MASVRGGRASTGRYRRRWLGLAGPAHLRLIVVIGLAVGALLGGGYVLGHALGTPEPASELLGGPPSAPADTGAGSPAPALEDQSSSPGAPASASAPAATPAPTASAGSDPALAREDERPRLRLAGGGPYTSRVTTGSYGVALTFDDGPNPQYTPQVLAELDRYRVKATFCLVGELAQAYPDLVRAIAAAGHTLCNHSWSHDPTLASRTRAAIRTDLSRTNAAIRAAVPDARIAYYRQPYGSWTAGVVATAWELGMTSVHWDVDSVDYHRPGAGSIASNVTARVGAGSIVLMHDAGGNRQQTVTALRTILPNLLQRFGLESLPTGPLEADQSRPG
ncbi:polysaccharide deacetylase family protein [Micromonospora sp. NPDC050397]|uniref:polysaccharide deacetylase family protein n=1 Tax=Micromonospora sp. NPDC050397 TaxID=3364279 RepID=UPI00384E5533